MNDRHPISSSPFAHTYSIVARDPVTGYMGVAVQSHWFSVGTIVTWAEAGAGAIATQSFANPNFGRDGLELLRSGKSAVKAVEQLLEMDDGRDYRQLAIVDAQGNAAAWTGASCISHAGHDLGDQFSVQANMMISDRVWPAMKAAFERSSGALEVRMLAALEAGEEAGGDIRGRQSAALLVVRQQRTGKPWEDRSTDLRVEDHAEPLKELRRLYDVKCAYDHMNKGDAAMEAGEVQQALECYSKAQSLNPGNPEASFWMAVALVNAGDQDTAMPIFEQVFTANQRWRELLRRIRGTVLFRADRDTAEHILGKGG